jgi:alpha-glucosidase
MPWNAQPGAGFTSGRPWLPLPPDFAQRNVAAESADDRSVLNTYRALLRLRRATPALERGAQELVAQDHPDALTYRRTEGDAGAFVALNFASRRVRVSVPAAPAGRTWRVVFSTADRASSEALPETTTLGPLEALVAIS